MKYSDRLYIGLGRVPIGIGAVLHGWDITEDHFRDPGSLSVVDFRAMEPTCPHNCAECFTDKNKKTLTLDQIKKVIDQIASMNTRAIDFLGEGEPTLDPDFFPIIEYTAMKGIVPIIFTEAASMMRDRDFVRRVFDTGASVIPKCNSLFNAEYQNWAVQNAAKKFFDQRNEALDLLISEGFNETMPDGTTRLGFDMVLSSRNIEEVEQTLRYCRKNNLWIIFSFHLPAGRSAKEEFDRALIPTEEQKKIMRATVKRVDDEFSFCHPIWNNFATTHCVEFLQIYGDGRISPCSGNETIMGYVQTDSIQEVHRRILERFPTHNTLTFDGHCPYRPKV